MGVVRALARSELSAYFILSHTCQSSELSGHATNTLFPLSSPLAILPCARARSGARAFRRFPHCGPGVEWRDPP